MVGLRKRLIGLTSKSSQDFGFKYKHYSWIEKYQAWELVSKALLGNRTSWKDQKRFGVAGKPTPAEDMCAQLRLVILNINTIHE